MPTISVNNYEIDYHESGQGTPVVLVHGSVSDHRVWAAQHDVFAEHFRVIAYSRRYHWPNVPIADGADYAMLEQVDDLRGVIESLNAAPAHLVGHSYGGFLCLLLAIRSPELVRTLTLAEPPVLPLFASNPPKPHELLKLLFTRPSTAAAVIKFGATGIGPATAAFQHGDVDKGVDLFGRAVLGHETFESMSADRMDQVRANVIPAEFLGSGFAPLTPQEVSGVHAPTLLLHAEKSPGIFRHFTDRLEELMPNAERVAINGASHNMPETNAPAFNDAVLKFLQRSEQ